MEPVRHSAHFTACIVCLCIVCSTQAGHVIPRLSSSCRGKPILHHFHIAKTGGTPVKYFLAREASSSGNWCAWSTEARYSQIAPSTYTRSVVMLREPFQWLFSAIYHDLGRGRIPTRDGVFWLRDALNHTLHIKKWGNTGYSYINYQTRWLAGGNVGTRLQLAAFERAKQLIDRMDVVGDPIYMRETVCLSLYTIRSSSFQKCNCSFLPPSGNVRVQQQHSAKNDY